MNHECENVKCITIDGCMLFLGEIKTSKTDITATSVQGNYSKHTRGSNERYVMRTTAKYWQFSPSTHQRTNEVTDVKPNICV
jgi:hypothetical protein